MNKQMSSSAGALGVRHFLQESLAAAALFAAAAATVQAAPRYQCEFRDGSRHLVQEDLSIQYLDAVARCEPMVLPVAAPAILPPVAWESRDRTRIIQLGPTWSDWTSQIHEAPAGGSTLPLIREISDSQKLDWALVEAVVHVESRHRPQARSPKGALGLMQLIPATAARYGVEEPASLFDPRSNLLAGTRYLKDLLAMFNGRTELALAAYNAGEGAVVRHGYRIPPYPETENYVRQVLKRAESNTAGRFLRDSP